MHSCASDHQSFFCIIDINAVSVEVGGQGARRPVGVAARIAQHGAVDVHLRHTCEF